MIKNQFLYELKEQGKLELVAPSENIKDSYTQKSNNCLISAKLLFNVCDYTKLAKQKFGRTKCNELSV